MAAQTICTAFGRYGATSPDAVAVSDAEGELTYAQLAARANQLARQLRRVGVTPGAIVGIWAERSAATVVMVLAVLKAGAAYLALDQRQPAEYRELILRDAAVRVVLTQEQLAADLPETVQKICVDRDWPAISRHPATPLDVVDTPDALAYVAYTSGSTGRPKGVCVPHRAVLRLVVDSDMLAVRADDVFLQFAPIAFDASTLEIWGPLLNGARLVVAPPGDQSPGALAKLVRRERVTILWLTAGLFHQLADTDLDELRGLRYLLAGGDVLSPPRVNRAVLALPRTILINGYGPTENTTFTCCMPVTETVGKDTVPIGRAIRGTGVYLLDEQLGLVTPGAVGEIYATGDGLAHGYLNSPGCTATRFVPNPFADTDSARMYRTGDLAREDPAGDLVFLGRADSQVKIRGFRVELGEVEALIAGLPSVARVAVVAQRHSPGGVRLIAHVVGSTAAISALAIRQQLARLLPSYAVPALVRVVDILPLTSSGKVDRSALENVPVETRPEVHADYRVAEFPLEQEVIDMWTDHLGIVGIGADDDFFELGGHSLLAVSVLEELRATFAVEISPLSFYLDPSPAGLARALHKATIEAAS
ncbi:amino acid adenylation domain-containing protein [Nocardia sp. NPDC060256]|uniref:amino acid adenylation domain-containing protein n=1 Tax=unclassified Nocardia TaxID=2637762 RepID=UPI00365BD50C